MRIKIKVLWHTDETRQLDDQGLPFDVDSLERRDMVFYNIGAISPNRGYEGRDYTNIHSSGDKFIAVYPIDIVDKKIKEQLNMTHQVIHELSEPWTVHTPLGKGTAMMITTPSYLSNSIVYVKLEATGELKHFDSNDIRVYGSPTYGECLDPKIPDDWVK